jgi:hypothetical protein
MRRISSLVLAASVLFPLSFAHAATEVAKLSSNNQFASAFKFDPDAGTFAAVFVTREKTKGQPRDSISIMLSTPDGFSSIRGTIPHGALKMSAKSASVDVAIGEIDVEEQTGDFDPDAIVSVDWQAGERSSQHGNTTQDMGGGFTAHIVGTFTQAPATASGELLGAPFTAASADMSTAHQMVVIKVTSN